MRTFVRRLAAVTAAVVVGAVMTVPGTAQAEVSRNDGIYMISALHSSKCLDVQDASMNHMANVLQANCTGTWNQQWIRRYATTGWFVLVARHSGKCLDVAWASTAHGADVIQGDCWAGYNQQWREGPVQSDGTISLIARHSGKCLDVQDASTAHGANVLQGTCWNGRNQRWYMNPVYVP
ncbi:RICIN domain-containing protein [Catellatospora methionotrophica]|uniref:RICIN domain-containing protein n=1 Tax=Catellatospora methionotrophica TaxID=121620 RepID=UPI0033EB9E9B